MYININTATLYHAAAEEGYAEAALLGENSVD
jgi:hypothetical protein